MSSGNKSASFTSEFGQEFEVQRQSWLRVRFLWYTGVVAVLWTSVFVVRVITQVVSDPASLFSPTTIAGVLTFATFASAFVFVRRRTELDRQRLVRLVFALIVVGGILQLIPPAILAIQNSTGIRVRPEWLGYVFFFHLFACMFLPLTAVESLKPLVPLLAVNAVFMLIGDHSMMGIIWILLTPLIGGPGAIICSTRHGRFRRSFSDVLLALSASLAACETIHRFVSPRVARFVSP